MDKALLDRFIAITGERHALVSDADKEPHLHERRRRWTGKTPVVLKPGSTAEVAAILALANETGTAIVPQGGNTGLVGGQIPDHSGEQVVLALTRMNRIRDVDLTGNTMTVDAGCTLQAIHDAADVAGRLFPLTLASQGSCQIGGNLSANAGGTAALAFGVARDLCLGLEIVLPSGEIIDDLSVLKKDNTGYALRQLFIGAEGTLGIITAATLKLFPKPAGRATAFVALASAGDALKLLSLAQARLGGSLTTFELMADLAVVFSVRHANVRHPLPGSPSPWWVLMEVSSLKSEDDASSGLQDVLEQAFADTLIPDAVIAKNESERAELWAVREGISEAQLPEGVSIKHDISVPVHTIPDFISDAQKAVLAIEPDARICPFGHMGDGNLHYNVSQPEAGDRQAFLDKADAITHAVHELVRTRRGSISAEHGIGIMKKNELAQTKTAPAMGAMRAIKHAIDPNGIMNPGKVLDA